MTTTARIWIRFIAAAVNRHTWRKFRALSAASIVLLVGSGLATAQTGSGSLQGRVTDVQDGPLVGVTVTVQSPGLPAPLVLVTDATGAFAASRLTPGEYAVELELVGFQTVRETVSLRNGDTTTLDVQLGLAPVTEQVSVVGVTPLLGATIGRERLPATVSVVGAEELRARGAPSVSDALNERIGAISMEGTTANLFQPTLRFRGFTASPLLGLPQGIAVYQNGVRVNEPFGDTVQFDLMPMFAVNQIQLSAGADPTYGLNALGGALALQLKSGFDLDGFRGELSGGSFGRLLGTAEYGAQRGAWGMYVGATRFDETGWRLASPSSVNQAVVDLAYRADRVNAGVNVTYANTRLNGNSAAPIELLAVDRAAVFTFPDTTENELGFIQGRVGLTASDTWTVQVTGYYRDLDRDTLNGDEADFAVCEDAALPPDAPPNTLCHSVGGPDADDDAQASGSAVDRVLDIPADPLVDTQSGVFITDADAAGNAAFNRTSTQSQGYGATVQASATGDHNVLVLGASADLADVAFASNSEVGTLTEDRSVAGSGLFVGIFGRAPDDQFNTSLVTDNRTLGAYFSDTLSVTERVHLTVSGRFNHSRINIFDQLGTSLNGDHTFSRFNGGVGGVFELNDAASVFARYTESNRAPTAAELSCADPDEPCRVPNAFLSDPPLEQAVAKSFEGGVRGNHLLSTGHVEWSASWYRTRINDDILFVASSRLIGTGFFQNAGDTQRVGLDADLRGRVGRVTWFASYGLVNATFESPLELPGNTEVNDATNSDGQLEVQPGDRLAGIPRHSFKTGVGIAVTPRWDVALETIVSSSRIFLGDEGNDQLPVDGYGVANFRSSYRLTDSMELFARVDNLLDIDYETFGLLAEVEIELNEVPNADDPRFLSPGAPRSGFAGIRVQF
jgi:iron complex outermembrane receptor protein